MKIAVIILAVAAAASAVPAGERAAQSHAGEVVYHDAAVAAAAQPIAQQAHQAHAPAQRYHGGGAYSNWDGEWDGLLEPKGDWQSAWKAANENWVRGQQHVAASNNAYVSSANQYWSRGVNQVQQDTRWACGLPGANCPDPSEHPVENAPSPWRDAPVSPQALWACKFNPAACTKDPNWALASGAVWGGES